MKKLLIIPAVVGLVAIPSIAMARQGADDPSSSTRADESSLRQELPASDDSSSSKDKVKTEDSSSSSSSSDDNSSSSSNQTSDQAVSLSEARSIAQSRFPDLTIKKVEIEHEHGVVVYSVRFTNSTRVDVSSLDGSITRVEAENVENESSDDSNDDSDDDHDSDDDSSHRSGRNSDDD